MFYLFRTIANLRSAFCSTESLRNPESRTTHQQGDTSNKTLTYIFATREYVRRNNAFGRVCEYLVCVCRPRSNF